MAVPLPLPFRCYGGLYLQNYPAFVEDGLLDLIDASDYNKAVDLPSINADSEPRGRALSESEIEALLNTCGNPSAMDIRDAAIIIILRGAGLRRRELVNLDLIKVF